MVHDGDFVLQLLDLVVHEFEAPLHVLDDVLRPRCHTREKEALWAARVCFFFNFELGYGMHVELW